MINLSVFLYGNPAWNLPIESEEINDGQMFKKHGIELKECLDRVGCIVNKLCANGWSCSGTLYTLEFYKEGITKSDAKKELKKLDISLKEVHIEEYDVDEE